MNRPTLLLWSALVAIVPAAPAGASAPLRSPERAIAVVVQGADGKVLKALDAWLKQYRAGKIDFASRDDVTANSIAKKYGVLPKGLIGTLSAQRELDIMLEQAAALNSAEAAETLLTFAAIGLDEGRIDYKLEMAPFSVRALGEKWLGKLADPAAIELLTKYARGEARGDKTYGAGMEAAAVRWVGTRKDPTLRTMVEQRLGAGELAVRIAAAEALQQFAAEESVPALAEALAREQNDVVIAAISTALRRALDRYVTPAKSDGAADGAAAPPTPPQSATLAVRAAIGALGRASWRGDMELIKFLAEFRSAETIPALIEVLQRFKDHPEEIESGKLSGLLLYRAHETLVSMTGAVFPADKPELWRELWEREQGKLLVQKRSEPKPTDANTVVRAFCGIPVQGTRILFIVDLSGSMNFPMRSTQTVSGAVPDKIETQSRLDFAKKQLAQVVEQIPEVSHVNFITYNGEPKAKTWQKDLLLANEKNKKKALEFVAQMRADGGTNMWAGLEQGLKMKSLIYGQRYETAVDEIFVVSDGAPSVGEVVDPVEILRLVNETNRFSKVRINTIFITSPNEQNPRNTSMAPSELMRRMAEVNGGKFVELKN